MAVSHIKAIRQVPGAEIAALGNPSGRNLDGDFSKVFGNIGSTEPVRLDMTQVKGYRDLDAMFADESIDVINICTPTHTHLELTTAALRAGRNVLCEKPMARVSGQAREMVEAAKQSGKILMPAMCLRFWPGWDWARTAIASGRYGKVLSARFTRLAEPPAWGQQNFLDGAKSGGALLDLHIHDMDFAQACFGRPKSVFAQGYTKLSGAIDHAVAQLHYANGPIVHVEGGWTLAPGAGFRMSYLLNFENATADYDFARGADALKVFEAGKEPQVIPTTGADGYVGEISYIAEAIRSGQPLTRVTAADGVAAIQLIEAEEKSIQTGTVVML